MPSHDLAKSHVSYHISTSSSLGRECVLVFNKAYFEANQTVSAGFLDHLSGGFEHYDSICIDLSRIEDAGALGDALQLKCEQFSSEYEIPFRVKGGQRVAC